MAENPSKSDNRQKKQREGKMKYRFLLQCIFPAAIVMGIVCYVSILLSQRMSSENMMSALRGQQESKVGILSDNINTVLNSSQLDTISAEILLIVEHSPNNELFTKSLRETVNRMASQSTILSKVQVAVFDREVIIGSRGFSSEFTGEEYWYDREKLEQCQNYMIGTPSVKLGDVSLFTFVYPVVNSSGDCVAAIAFGTNDQALTSMIGMQTNIGNQVWFITDSEDRLFFVAGNSNDINELARIAEKVTDESVTVNAGGTPYIMKKTELHEFSDYMLCYVVPVEPLIQQSRPTMIMLIVFAVISTLLIIAFVMSFSDRIVKEVNNVRSSVKGIAKNDFVNPIEVNTNDEMGKLVSEINSVVDKLKYQAEHDSKTNFYNSEAFAKKSLEYISANQERTYAIVRVDVDNFSFINDIFDWEIGDRILLGIADDLTNVFGPDAIFGYLGNDVFVICVGYVFLEAVTQKIERANEEIKKSAEKYMPITVHFGICENAGLDMDISILCDYAGIALKTVKGNLLQIYAIYDEKFDENHKVQKFVESNKITALENHDFYIVLQPKCNIFSGEVVGAEALVRWKDHTSGEIISPGKFIPIFEKNGFVITLDRFVWEETCKVIKKWRDHGYKDIPVSVNVSRMHIIHDTFVDEFADLVRKYEIPPELVEVEITESALLENSEDALQDVMSGLKGRGFKLLMDDFASGYSSLIALQRLPFDVIKIDKGLIDKIGEGFNREFVSGIIAFLREIKKDIVIEGVEFDWQKEILKDSGGKIIQGFCFSKPVSVSEFERLAFGEIVPDED
ncbi:EAL domain-containing protein [Ruminococcus sp. HUN007]|uniref:EAL domain-containing protein n=1 Tax=Ruminococcus sp. HUN007 TaxID=1514668 RepID=UPI0005D2473C|nr:EAL domain-containing protein [Ruminococcus sp. HUN007]